MKKHAIPYLLLMSFAFITQSMEKLTPSPSQWYQTENNCSKIKDKFNKLNQEELSFDHPRWTQLLNEASFHEEHADLVEQMLTNGVNVHYQDDIGNTPLMRACWSGCTKIVSLLLKHNANPNLTNNYGESPLTKAAKEGHLEVIVLLLQHEEIEINAQERAFGDTALICAVKTDLFTSDRYQEDITLRREVVRALLHAQADPSIINKEGHTAIAIAKNNNLDDLALLMKAYDSLIERKDEFKIEDYISIFELKKEEDKIL